jgi:hypothetical protein
MFSDTQPLQSAALPFNLVINKISSSPNYKIALASVACGALFFLMAIFSLPYIILSPQSFTMFFTLSMICLITALAYFNGPLVYMKKLSEKKNIFASAVLVGSILMSLYFSLIQTSYVFSLLFCFIEVIFNPTY